MKKSLLLLGFISYLSFGQITDQNGNSAASSNGTTLSGDIKIGSVGTYAYTLLDVYGSQRIGLKLTSGQERIIIGDNWGIGELGMFTTEDDVLAVKFNNRFEYGGGVLGSGRLVVTQAGNVGIGTNNPSSRLDVFGQNALAINGYAIIDVDGSNNVIKIGDVDGNDAQLALYDNSTSEIVRIANGKVGIGTTNPLYKLDVNGNTRSNIFTTGPGAGMEYRQYGPEWGLYMGDLTSNDVSVFINGFGSTYEDAASTIRVGDGELYFRTQQQTAMFINDVQNIGVGTLYPTESLHLFQGNLMLESDGYESLKIKFKENDLGDMYDFGVDGGFEGFRFDVNSSNKMIIKKNGNVGIGTINPDEALSVNGTIHSKEVRVDLIGWPDYVFDENYDLPSLKDVEKYIKENGHLENIQSAVEVEENGILVGEMNKKLLEKIEELTLYLIQQNKDIEELKKQVEFLKQKQ